MKKKVIIKATLGLSLILTGILTSRVMFTSAASDFASGSGTEKDPYIIETKEQLQNVGKYCGKDYDSTYFKIDETVKTLDMEGKNFTPICSLVDGKDIDEDHKDAFYGNFDGSNAEIINLKIETDEFFGGLFGATKDAIIKNVKIGKNSSVTVKATGLAGKDYNGESWDSPVGGIVGSAYNTAIENVSNAAYVSGTDRFAGGIVGEAHDSTIENVSNTGSITGDSNVGGIVGELKANSTLKKASNSGIVTGDGALVGGIVGDLSNSTLNDASNSGNVKAGKNYDGNSYAGGVAGYVYNSTIENVSNAASVTGAGSYVGGIAGYASSITMGNALNTASVTGKGAYVGGIVGGIFDSISLGTGDFISSSINVATNTGNVKAGKNNYGNSYVGGIAGYAHESSIEVVSNTASVSGDGDCVGGIVGSLEEGTSLIKLVKASNSGNVKAGKNNDGNSYAGGIVGYASDAAIGNVSNTASVSGEGERIGGIVGELVNVDNYSDAALINALNYNDNIKGSNVVGLLVGSIINYKSKTVKVQNGYSINSDLECIGYKETETKEITNVEKLSKDDFKDKSNFEGFDFDNTWMMGSDYPVLRDLSDVTSSNTTSSKVTVKYGNRVIDTSSYIHNNRTYVDLYDFCKNSKICEVNSEDGDIKTISKDQELSGGGYTYFVEHKKGTDTFKPSVLIGGREIVDNTHMHTSEVVSCPEEIKDENLQCGNEKLFVPVRFLTQALGFIVEWDGKTRTVTIEDSIKDSFNTKYETVITEGECNKENISSCKVVNKNSSGVYELSKGKTYYFVLTEKTTGKLKKYIKYFSFYQNVSDANKNKVDDGVYSFYKDGFKITLNKLEIGNNVNRGSTMDIGQVIIYEMEDNKNITGTIPIVINTSFIVK